MNEGKIRGRKKSKRQNGSEAVREILPRPPRTITPQHLNQEFSDRGKSGAQHITGMQTVETRPH